LSDVLSFPRTAVESLDLEGNPLGGQGLEALCLGLKINNSLQKLSLADIHILPTTDGAVLVSIMQIFGDAIAHHKTLIEVNLLRNILGEAGGSELLKHVKTNSKIQSLLVEDTQLPSEIYILLCRTQSQPPQKGASKKKRKTKRGLVKRSNFVLVFVVTNYWLILIVKISLDCQVLPGIGIVLLLVLFLLI
jgi:Ran GTPase-activating protein (RanGAP) involved in mRNA processing and transport